MSGPIRTQNDLDQLAARGTSSLYPARLKILVGSATCGIAAGARAVEAAAVEAVKRLGLDAVVARTGCIGFCQREPLLDLVLPDGPRISYGNMTANKTTELLEAYAAGHDLKPKLALCRLDSEEHVASGERHIYSPLPPAASAGWESGNKYASIPAWSDVDFYRRQSRIILRNCGSIDPLSLEEAIARGAYRGALRALTGLGAEAVIEEVLKSGLRGRGGAGFPTGRKWQTARQVESDVKYVICNADEGDPGAFMDRSVLEGDPHAVIEGMLIGSLAVGAHEGYIYVRSEYPLAVSTITGAIRQAEESGLLGDDIFGSGHSLRIKVRRGAGAFVCGEETSLIASIEGYAGEPRPRPPFPAVKGLWGKPTVINNVKTWASVGPILSRGAAWYASQGTERNRGTTVFALVGAVKNTGLVEIPLGMTLREMVFEIGGGMRSKRPIKAVQTGGPSGGCIPASLLDLLDRLRKTGPGGLDDGLRRHDRDRLGDLHGRPGPLLPGLYGRRIVRQVLALPRGDQAHAPHPHADLRGPRHRRGPPLAGTPGPHGQVGLALRAGRHGAEPGAHGPAILPRRVRGAHQRQEMPCGRLPQPDPPADRPGSCASAASSARMSAGRCHRGPAEVGPSDRRREVYPLRRLPERLPERSNCERINL